MSRLFPPNDENESTRLAPVRSAPSVARNPPGLEMREITALAAANPILAAANPLLMTLQTLRTASPPSDIIDLRNKLIETLKEFDSACTKGRVSDLDGKIANYALCAVVDECVQMTPWGGTANWAQQSLLIHFHRENWGGEKFFDLLNRIAGTPAKYPALLELFYVCLALGFMGRFHLDGAAGRQSVADLREKLFQLIRQGRPEVDRTLSTQWCGMEVASRRFRGFGLIGVLLGVLAVSCLGLFAFYFGSLGDSMDGLHLERLALQKVPATAVSVAPAAKPRLAQLLKVEIDNKQLDVRDLQLESKVTLLGGQLFESGSAVPSGLAVALIDKVGDALKQVEGKVVVTGHTDNVAPTRTLRFASNWELSNQRAKNVARLLAERLGDVTRISSEGRGDTDPVTGNDTPDGQSRNRRVEIVLKAADANQ